MSRPEAVHNVQVQVMTLGVALEALETLLVQAGTIKEGALMEQIRAMIAIKPLQKEN